MSAEIERFIAAPRRPRRGAPRGIEAPWTSSLPL
jgi:hypothetical protein